MKRFLGLLILLLLPIIVSAQELKPEPRSGHELVWHDGLGMVLLVNGDHPAGDNADAIWGWNGETWQVVDDNSPRQTLGGAAYDAAHNLLLLYGGSRSADDYNTHTWVWDGKLWGVWEEPGEPEAKHLGARDHLSMVYDTSREQIVLYGGQYFPTRTFYQDTWLWENARTGWKQVTNSAPDMRSHYAMAYDAAREQALIFGGTTGSTDKNDLWAWDGTTWQVIDTGTGPSRRAGARMAFDEANGVMVLFGGASNNRPLDDTWLWDGEQWRAFDGDHAPPARSHHAMAYDRVRQKLVLFGGYDWSVGLNDTWEWDMTNGWVEAESGE
jgi:hypothetical protein